MDFLLDALTDWLKEMLVGGIMSNLSGMFDTQGPYESQNQGRVQFNQEAAGLLRRRGAHRRTAVLFTPGACGKQRGCYVYDAGHAALLSDGNV